MNQVKKKEPFLATVTSKDEAIKAMRSSTIIVVWLAVSYTLILSGQNTDTLFLVPIWIGAAAAAYASFIGKRSIVLFIMVVGAAELAGKLYFMVMAGVFNGIAFSLLLGYLLIRSYQGWSFKAVPSNKKSSPEMLADEDSETISGDDDGPR